MKSGRYKVIYQVLLYIVTLNMFINESRVTRDFDLLVLVDGQYLCHCAGDVLPYSEDV